jgi:hypothetical protein
LRIRDVYPGSRVLIFTHPGFRISDPGSKNSNKRSTKEKNLGQFSKNYRTFYQKIVKKLFKIWSWDPGSGKNLFRIPDPGVKKAPDPGSGSATLLIRFGGVYYQTYNGQKLFFQK